IENYNSIYPLTSLSGYVHVHNGVEVGSNATIIPSKSVKDNSIVGAGSVVLENVEVNQIVAGVPSRIIKLKIEITMKLIIIKKIVAENYYKNIILNIITIIDLFR